MLTCAEPHRYIDVFCSGISPLEHPHRFDHVWDESVKRKVGCSK
jgi:hypothetical protein